MGRKKRRWAKWRARQKAPGIGRLVAWAEWVPKRRGELIRTNDKIVGVKRDYKTGAIRPKGGD